MKQQTAPIAVIALPNPEENKEKVSGAQLIPLAIDQHQKLN
jgi:hypothetical protein